MDLLKNHRYQALVDEGAVKIKQYVTRLKFQVVWVGYYILLPHIGAIFIINCDNVPYLDALFISTSAMTGAGLSTISIGSFKTATFAVLAILSILGSFPFMLIITALIRKSCFVLVHNTIMKKNRNPVTLSDEDQHTIHFYERFHRAYRVIINMLLFYYVFWLLLGLFILIFTLPVNTELKKRGFSLFDNAAFLSVNAFTNTGLSLTSDSLAGLVNYPPAYLVLCVLILAGNTVLPIFLRGFVHVLIYMEKLLDHWYPSRVDTEEVHNYKSSLAFILNHPRHLTTHIFSHTETMQLVLMNLFFITVQFVCFIFSTINRQDALSHHSTATLMGIGFFQTLSVRTAGFSMMDLRELNNGLIVIYCIMMYLSSFPLASTIQKSNSKLTKEAIERDESNICMTGGNIHAGNVADDIELVHLNLPSQGISRRLNREVINVLHDNTIDETEQDGSKEKTASKRRHSLGHQSNTIQHDVELDMEEFRTLNKEIANQYVFRHSFVLVLALIACAYSEDRLINDPKVSINMFYIAFEIISAYGSVGLSMGIPGQAYSLSGAMTSFGKLVMIAVMVLGKHRGLPSSSDEVMDYSFEEYKRAWHYEEGYNDSDYDGNTGELDKLVDRHAEQQESELDDEI